MVSLATPVNFARSWQTRGPGRTLLSTFGRLGVPLSASRAITSGVKITMSLPDYLLRRREAARARSTLSIPRDKDYAIFRADEIPGLDEVKQHCEGLFERHRDAALSATKAPFSLIEFYKTVHGPAVKSPDELRPIVQFLSQPALVEMAANYIGEMPVLGNVCVWYTFVNSAQLGAQNIHRDMNCRRQIHIVIPIWPIDEGTGPFTFLPGDKSRNIVARINHNYGRFDDDDFYKLIDRNEMIAFTSDKGAVLAVNPYACFHFGGRAKTKPRFVLICSYTSRFESAEEGNGLYRLTNRGSLSDGSPVCERLLNL